MALARKCDRCKKLYEYYPKDTKIQSNAIRKLHKIPDGCISTQDSTIDLCPECMASFDKWMIEGAYPDDQN